MMQQAPAQRTTAGDSGQARPALSAEPLLVVVAAGRAGAGASTIAALFAHASARVRKTLLVDADERGAPPGGPFGPPDASALASLPDDAPAGRALVHVHERLSAVACHPAARTTIAPERRDAAFRRLATLYAAFDAVVVDVGARVAPLLAACNGGSRARIVAVTTDDPVAAAGAYALAKLVAAECPDASFCGVGNMLDGAAATATRALLEAAATRFIGHRPDFLGAVPDDPTLATALTAAPDAHGTGEADAWVTRSPAFDAGAGLVRQLLATTAVRTAHNPFSPTSRSPHGTR